jgi:hypothetical protein
MTFVIEENFFVISFRGDLLTENPSSMFKTLEWSLP